MVAVSRRRQRRSVRDEDMPSALDGRVALVTGAGRRRGIGRGIALELARAGADVAVHARVWEDDPWPHEELAALGRRYAVLEGDLTDARLVRGIARSIGAERLKPLRDALPRHVTYRMIRFVVADMQRATQEGKDEG